MMKKKPIICITPNYSYETETYSLHADYALAIEKAGGIPVILPPCATLPDFADGLLLSGGSDVDPLLFSEEPLCQNGEINPLRDAYEMRICKDAFEKKVPLLGICRGMQVMNLVAGGKIYQDIATQTKTTLKHDQQAPRNYGTHTIFIEKNDALWQTERFVVNSMHHQSCSALGDGFCVLAKSADGLIEAIKQKTHPFAVGVQWHPEAMQTEETTLLFASFLNAAKAYQNRR